MPDNSALTGQNPFAADLQPQQSAPVGTNPFAEDIGQPTQADQQRTVPMTPEETLYQNESTQGLFGTGTPLDTFAGRVVAGAGRAQDELVRGMSMGALPYIAGARGALNAAVSGGDIGQGYSSARDAERAAQAQYHQEHPVGATALDVLGGFVGMTPAGGAAAAAAAPATTTGRVLSGAKAVGKGMGVGAATGAASGAMSTSGDWGEKAQGAIEGAIAGTVGGVAFPVGAAVLSGAVRGTRNALSPASAYVGRRIMQALQDNGMAPDDAARTYRQWQSAGSKPDTLMEIGGDPMMRLARSVYTQGGEGAATVNNFLTQRAAEAPDRMQQDLENTIVPSRNVYEVAGDLKSRRSTTADPFYKSAFAANPNMQHPALDGILETPALRQAQAQAMTRMQNKMIADPSLQQTMQQPRSLRYLDLTKQSLDDMINQARVPGALDPGKVGTRADLIGLKNQFVNILDEADATRNTMALGDYAKARAAYSGPSQSLGALQDGMNFLKQAPELTEADLARLNPSDQEHYRLGGIRALQNMMDTPPGVTKLRNAFSPIAGRGLQKQIRALVGNDADFDRLGGLLQREAAMQKNYGDVLKGSQSINKAADVSGDTDFMHDLAHTGFDVATGKSPIVAGAQFGMRQIQNAGRKLSGMTPARASALADALTGTGQRPVTTGLLEAQAAARRALPGQRAAAAASRAGAAGAGSAAGQLTGQLTKDLGYDDGGAVRGLGAPLLQLPPPPKDAEGRADAIERLLNGGAYVGKKLGFGGRAGFDDGGGVLGNPLPPENAEGSYNALMGQPGPNPPLPSGHDIANHIATGALNIFPHEGKTWRDDLNPSGEDMQRIANVAMGFGGNMIDVWHGSPHTFDAFDMSKIGTGEGNQAFGHGLYFADNPAVAQTYAHDFSGTRDYEVPETGGTIPRWVGHSLKSGGDRVIDSHIADFQNRLAEAQQELATSDQPWNVQDRIPRLQSVVDNLQAIKNGAATARDPANLYRVSIDAEPEHFLDWDRPLSEQSPHVQGALASLGVTPKPFEQAPGVWQLGKHSVVQIADKYHLTQGSNIQGTFGNLNDAVAAANEGSTGAGIVGSLGNSAEAAQRLQQAGIPGIRYLDQGSRMGVDLGQAQRDLADWQTTSPDTPNRDKNIAFFQKRIADYKPPTHNYVLFDPSKAKILERNGQTMGAASPSTSMNPDVLAPSAPTRSNVATRNVRSEGIVQTPFRSLDIDGATKLARSGAHLRQDPDTGQYVGAPRGMDSPGKLAALRRQLDQRVTSGIAGRNWYGNVQDFSREITGNDPPKMDLLASEMGLWSPQATPDTNEQFLLQGHNAYEAGTPAPLVRTGAQARNYNEARAAAEPPPMMGHNNGPPLDDAAPQSYGLPKLGKKTSVFAAHTNPNIENPTTAANDIWAARSMGYTNADGGLFDRALSAQEHTFMDGEHLLAADRANRRSIGGFTDWTPGRVQAAAWVGQRKATYVANGMGEAEAEQRAMSDFSHFKNKYTANATYEAIPGAGIGHRPGVVGGSAAEREAYSANPASSWEGPGGRDMIYNAMGMYVRPTARGRGYFQPEGGAPEANPGFVARPLVDFAKTGDKGTEVSPTSQAMLNAGEATRAYFDAQNMGAWHKSIPWDKPGRATSAGVPVDRTISEDEMLRLGALAGKHGLTPSDTGSGISLMNFGGGPQKGQDVLKALNKGGLGAGIKDILPDAGPAYRSGLSSDAINYQPHFAQAMEGQGSATRELRRYLTNPRVPAILDKLDRSPEMRQKVLEKFQRDEEESKRTGDPARKDIQNARRIYSGFGFKGLFDALDSGKVALPGLGGAGLLGLGLEGRQGSDSNP